uniref:Uncharacterized protein n=1 Tax=Setaria italica TaxID=4555 RepID=K3YFG7_SETIT
MATALSSLNTRHASAIFSSQTAPGDTRSTYNRSFTSPPCVGAELNWSH